MNDGLPADDCVIVIVGGMGPMAGLKCFEYVMSNSITNGTDQDNLSVLALSFPKNIGDRTEYVFDRTNHNPAQSVLQFLIPQLKPLSSLYKRIVLGVPCITFHCPCIFSAFEGILQESFPNVSVVSIVSETVRYICSHYPDAARIGIMSTNGTRKVKPFQYKMNEAGKQMVYLSDDQQEIVTQCIFNTEW